ncbi:uncharacterized protein C8Q71DRAFT_489337 [Rhodofomes roseus]|uniref:Uncharacterized protein n=1 Tax=Rhodofomes roseus TaxID=34475 RepID=A0ABQ8KLA2_9APHY|nr:uncharacterized protein C8Q71DRAFT_489337 [Rhodofomes roseus]KAH9838991.1 hypothetical protein C8Q71DRAFT_489337 [Rhodofomes roseus]
MAPPRRPLCWLVSSGMMFASLTLLCFCFQDHDTAILSVRRTRNVPPFEHLLYKAEERYGESIAMRDKLIAQLRLDDSIMPNATTLLQLFPASFNFPSALSLAGKASVYDLRRFAGLADNMRRSRGCAIVTVGPMDDNFASDVGAAVPDCSTTAYTPGPAGFGHGRVFQVIGRGGYTLGRGWVGLGPLPTPAKELKLLGQQAGGVQRLYADHEHAYTLERLLGGDKSPRFADVLRVDLPFNETVYALASLSSAGGDDDATVLPTAQLILTFRPSEDQTEMPQSYLGFRSWWESLERVGMRPSAVHWRDDGALEYTFMNIRAFLLSHSGSERR